MNEVCTCRKFLNLQIFMFSDSLHNSTDFGFDIDIFDFIKHFLLVCQSSASENMMNTFIKKRYDNLYLMIKKNNKNNLTCGTQSTFPNGELWRLKLILIITKS